MACSEEGFQLADKDAIALAQELFRARLIKKDIMDNLNKMSPKVPNSVKHRYLFSNVYEEIKSKKKHAFMTVIDILIHFPSIPVSTTDIVLIGSEHIPDLVELLARYASKWKFIGTSLRFQPQDLDRIQTDNGYKPEASKLCMIQLLGTWIKRECKHTLPPTLRNLEHALNSELVGLGALACKVRKIISVDVIDKTTTWPYRQLPYYVVSSVGLEKGKEYVCQNEQHIQAEENESFLLEIQASEIERVTYCWESDYSLAKSITSSSTLCIPAVDIAMHGCQFSCTVKYINRNALNSADNVTTSTEAVSVHVHCSPLDNIRDELIAKIYLAQPEVPKDKWPPLSNKKFINLALIKQEPADYMNKITQLTIRGDLDDILKDKEIIEYNGLLKNLRSRDVLLIEGRPGSGKTTLVHKITHDWATSPQEYSKTIRSLFLVSLRVLNTLNKPRLELSDILQLFKRVKISNKLIEEREGYGVCFIFDGLDEFSPLDGEESIVYKIIKKEYLCKSIVIVASRPAATAHLRSRATKVVEVLGFQNDQIFEYFNHYPFSEATKPAKLKKFLLSHPNILHICYLPIHVVMVAFLFEVKGEVLKTETEIYKHFTNFTVMRNLSKVDYKVKDVQDLGEKELIIYKQVCQLALVKTILNKQILNQDEVNFAVSKEGDSCLGLITLDHTADLYDIRDVYTFLHLTFQEYLAACHISTLNYRDQINLIVEHGHKNHMLVVWKFFCGLVKFDTSNNDSRFKIILQKIITTHLFHIQCAHESQQTTACTQFLKVVNYHISVASEHLQIPDFTAIGYVTSKSVPPVALAIKDSNINADAMNALAAETKENPNFKKIEIINSIDSYEAIVPFADVLQRCTNLKELDICNNNLTDEMAETLAVGLKGCKTLENITITNNKMTSKGASAICESLKHSNLTDRAYIQTAFAYLTSPSLTLTFENDPHQLQELVLKHGLKSVDDAKSVAVVVSHCHSLQVLDLSDNLCEDQVAKALFDNLKMFNQGSGKIDHSLQKLILHNNKIKQVGAKALARCFASHYSNLLVLDLNDNRIGNVGTVAIMERLNSLEKLFLQNNMIESEGAIAVASHILSYGHLHTLWLTNNKIDRDGIEALAQSFTQCHGMQRIDIGGNNIGITGVTLIAESLRGSVNHLKELRLDNSKLGNQGAEVLSSHLPCYHELQSLSLISNKISKVNTLAQSFSQCHNLQILDLSKNSIESAEMKTLSLSLKKCPSLVELHLANCMIENDGMQALASNLLPGSILTGLNLSNNKIAGAGAEVLADSLKHCTKLNWLNLSENQLDTKAALLILSGVSQCPCFVELILSGNRIKNTQALKHANIHIVSDFQVGGFF